MIFSILMLFFQIVMPAPLKAAPMDVPPIVEEYGATGYSVCDMGQCTFVEIDGAGIYGAEPKRRTRFTCADKRRFLMTAEDGSKHCLKLGE